MPSRAKRSLSPRQAEIATLVKSGKTSRQIGQALFIDPRTVDSHIDTICDKLGVRTRVEMVVALFGRGAAVSEDTTAQRALDAPGILRTESPAIIGSPETVRNHQFTTNARHAEPGIPRPATTLVGRDALVWDIVELLDTYRLITLVGTGGVGKTRVALEVSRTVLEASGLPVRFIELAPVANSDLAIETIAASVGVHTSDERATIESLVARLRSSRFLLVLDNCEHLLAGIAPFVDAVLLRCSNVKIIATSREALDLPAERICAVPPLTIPAAGKALSTNSAAGHGAVELFVERAQAVSRGFVLNDGNVGHVVEICRRLDGLPLAIELAATRVPLLGVVEICRRLNDRFRLLGVGRRTELRRHRTLRASIDWSFDLLSAQEQTLLRHTAIFVGGWTIEAAEAVCSDTKLLACAVFDLLASLVAKSLVVAEVAGGRPRYRLPESIQAYCLEQLDDMGERTAIAARHAHWADEVTHRLHTAYAFEARERWLSPALDEIDNARAALIWSFGESGDPGPGARIAANLATCWWELGRVAEGRRWVEIARDRIAPRSQTSLEGHLWIALATLSFGKRRVTAAIAAIAIFERIGDDANLATGYLRLAVGYRQSSAFHDCEAAAKAAMALYSKCGLSRSLFYGNALSWRASALLGLAKLDEARSLYQEAIALSAALGDDQRVASQRLNLAEVEYALGDVGRALHITSEAAEALRRGSDYGVESAARLNAAAYLLMLGNIPQAKAQAREGLGLALRVQHPIYIAVAVLHLATAAALSGDGHRAALLKGFVDAQYLLEGAEHEPTESRTYEILVAALGRNVPITEIEDLTMMGTSLQEEQAILLATSE